MRRANWTGKPPRIPPDVYQRAQSVRIQRAAARRAVTQAKFALREAQRVRDSLPTDAELAAECGVTQQSISCALLRGIKRYDREARAQP